ncbi:MAG TPA: efflux RND transporter permease subunit, partial [Gammaproteobacteria bacterium]|nr:efflux RND transporter permease subunit [Gammaproteobacteria bacterium]
MTLPELSIRRPVLTLAGSLLVTLAGLVALTRLPVREYPAIDPPTLSVSTNYSGAAAEVIEAQITEPLEAAINTVGGITSLRSTSREGASQISVEFSLETNLEAAASDVRDQIARTARKLPADVDPPLVNKADADSSPILGLALSSDRRSQLELGELANNLKERLQTIPGIAEVQAPAEKRYAMRLWIDAEKLRAYGLTPLDVRQAANRENVELPSGRIEGLSVELPVKTLSRLGTPEEFESLVIKRNGDRVVRFGDVGRAELGAQNDRGSLKFGAKPIAGLYFKPQAGANQIEIVDELRRRLTQVERELPEDVTVAVAYDNTEYVRHSLLEVEETIVVAFVLVVLVVFAFLREWRTTLIPVVAIPVSIVGALALMQAAGFSINTLTLLGIVLSIGLVVDDAIVVLENVYAKIESGSKPFEAAVSGTNEVFTAVIATTIALVVVFLPLLFMAGLSGRLFREFGLTISGAVLISAAVALTLTPMLSSRLLGAHKRGRLFVATEPFFAALERRYSAGLAASLRRPWVALLVLAAAGGAIWWIQTALPRELSPLEDRGRVWVRASAPDGVSYEYMQSFMDEIAAETARRVPEAHIMMTQVPANGGNGAQGAVNNGFVRLFLDDPDRRSRTQQEIAADLRSLAREYTGARVNITQEQSIGERRANSIGVEFVLQAPELETIREKLPAFLAAAREDATFSFVDSDLKFSSPELRVSIDREKAQSLGVSAHDIAETLQAGLSGQRFGYFVHDGRQYDVIGQLTRDLRSRPDDLGNLTVRTTDGRRLVRL